MEAFKSNKIHTEYIEHALGVLFHLHIYPICSIYTYNALHCIMGVTLKPTFGMIWYGTSRVYRHF